MITAGNMPAPVARWAASLSNDHRRSPTNRTREALRLSGERKENVGKGYATSLVGSAGMARLKSCDFFICVVIFSN
jgi:hypothetical protein